GRARAGWAGLQEPGGAPAGSLAVPPAEAFTAAPDPPRSVEAAAPGDPVGLGLDVGEAAGTEPFAYCEHELGTAGQRDDRLGGGSPRLSDGIDHALVVTADRKSTRLNSSHVKISYAVFCLKKKKHKT